MKRVGYFARGLWVDKHFAMWVTSIVILIDMGLGTAIVAGGVERFSPPSYNPLIAYSHGQTWIWGLWIAGAAILITVPFRWVTITGLWFGMFWCMIWQGCFIIAAGNSGGAPTTPIPVYGGLALLHAALLTARVIEKTEG